MTDDIQRGDQIYRVEDRGFVACAYAVVGNDADAVIEISRGDEPLRRFTYPLYKIYNIAAHFSDIVDGELANDDIGYRLASSTGIGETGATQ